MTTDMVLEDTAYLGGSDEETRPRFSLRLLPALELWFERWLICFHWFLTTILESTRDEILKKRSNHLAAHRPGTASSSSRPSTFLDQPRGFPVTSAS